MDRNLDVCGLSPANQAPHRRTAVDDDDDTVDGEDVGVGGVGVDVDIYFSNLLWLG